MEIVHRVSWFLLVLITGGARSDVKRLTTLSEALELG
jgi:hypothetical protein